MNLIILFKLLALAGVLAHDCEFDCSHIIDPVCGMLIKKTGITSTKLYQNICYFNRIKCGLKHLADIQEVPYERCGMKAKKSRRVNDFSIVGAHQACNHSCPTYCIDTYDPVCAFMHYPGKKEPAKRTMVNHCHVDLFSCSMGVNVSIGPMNKCITGQSLLFMSSVAAMKSLGFVKESQRRSSLTLDTDVRAGQNEYKPDDLIDQALRNTQYASGKTPKLEEKREPSATRRFRWWWVLFL